MYFTVCGFLIEIVVFSIRIRRHIAAETEEVEDEETLAPKTPIRMRSAPARLPTISC